MKLHMILSFGVLVRGMYNEDSDNIRNRLIVENQIRTTEMNSDHLDLTGEQVHEKNVFYDTFPKPESNGANYEVEDGNLSEKMKSRKRIIEELVNEALPLTQYWTKENIEESIIQNYDYDCDKSTKIDRCKKWIKDTLKESQYDDMNNMEIDAENKLKKDQIRNKIKELFTKANGNQLVKVEDLNEDTFLFFVSKKVPKGHELKPYKMKVHACKPQDLRRDKTNWRLKHNLEGLKLTQNQWPIEDKMINYLTLCEQMRVGQTCVKLYNRYCANNQYFTVSTTLASKCQCGFGDAGGKYDAYAPSSCKCDKSAPYGFYLMPPVGEFDKVLICLYSKHNEDRLVNVNLCLEDESENFKTYCTSYRKINFEIWKLPGKNRFKVVKRSGWTSEVEECNESLGRLFKVENLSSWGQINKPIEMEIHLFKNRENLLNLEN